MILLVYYNVVHKNFVIIYDTLNYAELGDTYKINSQLVSIVNLNEHGNYIKICRKKIINFKYKLGKWLINLGKHLQGIKPRPTTIIYKSKNSWWKY